MFTLFLLDMVFPLQLLVLQCQLFGRSFILDRCTCGRSNCFKWCLAVGSSVNRICLYCIYHVRWCQKIRNSPEQKLRCRSRISGLCEKNANFNSTHSIIQCGKIQMAGRIRDLMEFDRDGCSSRVRFTKYEQKKKRGHFAKKTKRPLLLLMADIHQVLMSHPIKDFQWMFFLNKLHGNGHVLKVFLHDVFALR